MRGSGRRRTKAAGREAAAGGEGAKGLPGTFVGVYEALGKWLAYTVPKFAGNKLEIIMAADKPSDDTHKPHKVVWPLRSPPWTKTLASRGKGRHVAHASEIAVSGSVAPKTRGRAKA